ncbi:hypothetical protein MJG53_018817 [Ovis ammon polii x Ovis aries]|uniref:Uncharacterized protein n=1 Tax=Ovis ammon polii x Ovis aries TaxID=2918886 RepID=A0ACB9U394_9CETA|nr:hypothetical protein MJG53_018817 [Ovis ammon polii x Ovis aries]
MITVMKGPTSSALTLTKPVAGTWFLVSPEMTSPHNDNSSWLHFDAMPVQEDSQAAGCRGYKMQNRLPLHFYVYALVDQSPPPPASVLWTRNETDFQLLLTSGLALLVRESASYKTNKEKALMKKMDDEKNNTGLGNPGTAALRNQTRFLAGIRASLWGPNPILVCQEGKPDASPGSGLVDLPGTCLQAAQTGIILPRPQSAPKDWVEVPDEGLSFEILSGTQKWHHSPRRLRTPRIPDSGLKLSTQHPKSKQIIPLATLSSAGAKSVTSSQTTSLSVTIAVPGDTGRFSSISRLPDTAAFQPVPSRTHRPGMPHNQRKTDPGPQSRDSLCVPQHTGLFPGDTAMRVSQATEVAHFSVDKAPMD